MRRFILKYSLSDYLCSLFNLLLSFSILLGNGPNKSLLLNKEYSKSAALNQAKKQQFVPAAVAGPFETMVAETAEDSESEDDQQPESCTPQFLKFNLARQPVKYVDSPSPGIRLFKVPLYILFCSLKTFTAEFH